MKKKFSIIIPVYNTEKYIRKCLDSIKNQSYKNYEVIIVNDGSTDNSLDIINEYIKDKKFKVYSKKNGGLSNARNYGLKYVTGDYICFLDSDDYYDENLLLELSKIKKDYDVIRFKTTLVDEESNIIRREKFTEKSGELELEQLKQLEYFELVGVNVFKKEFFINNKFKYEPNRNFEDYGLIPYCLAKANKIYYFDFYGHFYTQRKGGIVQTTTGIKRMEDLIYHYNNLNKKIDNDKKINEYNKKTVKSALAERLVYSLKYLPTKEINKYVNLFTEIGVFTNIKTKNLKKIIMKYLPTFYSYILKIKDSPILKKITPDLKLTIYLAINILIIFWGSFLVKSASATIDRIAFWYYYLLAINAIIILMLIYKHKYKYKKIDLFLFLAIIFGVIATIFAFDINISIYGNSERKEGFLLICYYISILILSSFVNKDKYKKIILYTLFSVGLFQVIFGCLQVLNKSSLIGIESWNDAGAFGTISNPNFYGTFMILCLSYAVGLFLDEKQKIKQSIYYILIIIFVIGMLLSNALSCILAFVIMLTILVIYLLIKKKFIKMTLLIISFIIPLILFTKLDVTTASKDLVQVKDEAVEISKGNLDDKFGTDRMYLWKNTLKIVPDHIWNGVGIDNFAYAFDGNALPVTYTDEIIYDKAHNEYLQILVTQGVFALICWLIIYLLIVNEGLIAFFKENKTYLLLPVVGYLIQAFFNISVIEVAPIFYIALGFCINREKDKNIKLDTI